LILAPACAFSPEIGIADPVDTLAGQDLGLDTAIPGDAVDATDQQQPKDGAEVANPDAGGDFVDGNEDTAALDTEAADLLKPDTLQDVPVDSAPDTGEDTLADTLPDTLLDTLPDTQEDTLQDTLPHECQVHGDCLGDPGICKVNRCLKDEFQIFRCVQMNAEEDSLCNTDSDLCTKERCRTGNCKFVEEVVCEQPVECELVSCNPLTAVCDQVEKLSGVACGSGDVCVEGVCKSCGNGNCEGARGETACNCPEDCGDPCLNRDCGTDGCGGVCGTCGGKTYCDTLVGLCKPKCGDGTCKGTDGESKCTCIADCGDPCLNKECGNNGCGGVCGTCPADMYCSNSTYKCVLRCGNGTCEASAGETKCTCPADCGDPCKSKNCGPDGCGGQCGACAPEDYCTGAGLCEPRCGDGFCNPLENENACTCADDCGDPCQDRECGNDGCGGTCGVCDANRLCTTIGACVAVTGTDWELLLAGEFQMGSLETEAGRDTDEVRHVVKLTHDFEIMTHEVTQGEYKNLVGSNPSYLKSCGITCPVESLTWHDALNYANLLSTSKGLDPCFDCASPGVDLVCSLKERYPTVQDCPGYRLPTEAEWEYAARAGTQQAFFSGHLVNLGTTPLDPNLSKIGWYGGNASATHADAVNCEDQFPGAVKCSAQPIQTKVKNAWRLFDMSGNVWEWTWDLYGAYVITDGGNDPTGPGVGTEQVTRGGSWRSQSEDCRSASRKGAPSTGRGFDLGFRLVRTLGGRCGDGICEASEKCSCADCEGEVCNDANPCTLDDKCYKGACTGELNAGGVIHTRLWAFEDGTIQGFTSSFGSEYCDWFVTLDKSFSPKYSVHMGNPKGGNFPDDLPLQARLESPPFTPRLGAQVSLAALVDLEPLLTRDLFSVSLDCGGVPRLLFDKSDTGTSPTKWIYLIKPLMAAEIGAKCTLVLYFNSVDGENNAQHAGVWVDDIAVLESCQ
jgi:formylglycine-generating enzyme required for sulfatase activity